MDKIEIALHQTNLVTKVATNLLENCFDELDTMLERHLELRLCI